MDRSDGNVWRFADDVAPDAIVVEIHNIGSQGGKMSLKATCRRNQCEGSERTRLLQDLMAWGSASENAHYAKSVALKQKYGMRVNAK